MGDQIILPTLQILQNVPPTDTTMYHHNHRYSSGPWTSGTWVSKYSSTYILHIHMIAGHLLNIQGPIYALLSFMHISSLSSLVHHSHPNNWYTRTSQHSGIPVVLGHFAFTSNSTLLVYWFTHIRFCTQIQGSIYTLLSFLYTSKSFHSFIYHYQWPLCTLPPHACHPIDNHSNIHSQPDHHCVPYLHGAYRDQPVNF